MLCGDINRKEIQKRADTHTHTHTHTHMTKKFQMYKLGIEKAEEPEIKLPPSVGS